jgi:hypothetical protein
MSQAQFFYEVDREQAEMEAVNTELQILAAEAREEKIDEQFRQFLQEVFGGLYEEIDVGCEFDLIQDMEAGWDLHKA